MAHSHIMDGYTSENDGSIIDGYTSDDDRGYMDSVCQDCGGPGWCYCFCCDSDEELESERLVAAHDMAQVQERVSMRAARKNARKNLRKFCIKVKVMLIANYWFFLTLRPGADATERAQKRFCAACVGSQY